MDISGTAAHRLASYNAHDWQPAWSPDGSRTVLQSNRDGSWEIYVMSADGPNRERVTHNVLDDEFPA